MKRYLKNGLIMGLCIHLFVSVSAQAKIIPPEQINEVSGIYHESDLYDDRFMKVFDIKVDTETDELTFREEHPFNGSTEDVGFPDLVYVVDEETNIGETEENFEKFKNGELPWANICISKEDIEKIYNENLRRVHVKYIGWLSSDIVTFPSSEDMQRNQILSDKGIMIGDEKGFAPYRILTRAELTKIAVMLYNPNFEIELNGSDIEFSDVNSEHWAYWYIAYARQVGIIDGYDDGTFRPDQRVLSEEAVKMFVEVLEHGEAIDNNYLGGYMKIAEDCGLLQNVNLYLGYEIIRDETAELAFNALKILDDTF